MQDNQTTLTTVIVNWNTSKLLQRCLQTLIENTKTEQVVWVVDNASTDDSVQMVRREFPAVRLEAYPHNVGFAAGNNIALNKADPSRYVLLLNPDTEVPPGAVDKMVEYLESNPDTGAVGVQLLNPDGTNQRSFDYFYNFGASFWRNQLVKKVFGIKSGIVKTTDTTSLEVDWIIGACVMLRATALNQIGFLDEAFFMYGEEIDLQWRLTRAGWKRVLLPQVNVIHYGGQSSKQAHLKMTIQEYRSRYLLISKHTSFLTRLLYLLKAMLGLAFWTAFWGARWVSRRDKIARANCSTYSIVLAKHLTPAFYTGGKANN